MVLNWEIAHLPFAFTEHGAIMAATILNNPRAVEMSLCVVRAFAKLRELLAANQELARRLDELERKLSTHDQAIAGILEAIRELQGRSGAQAANNGCERTRAAQWVEVHARIP